MVSRKLPLELEEEILIRVPPLSLARFRAVCKQWNPLFNDKRFVNNHLACARSCSEFILKANFKIYTVSFNINEEDPNIKVREYIPGAGLVNCDGFFYSDKTTETATVWNPWLRQRRLVEGTPYHICGMGYDSSRPEKSYKIFGFNQNCDKFVIYEFATNAWKFIDDPHHASKPTEGKYSWYSNVSLNGNLYWTAYNLETRQRDLESTSGYRTLGKA